MKPEDDEPSEEELREAAALAAALENDRVAEAVPPADAMEAASLLRHARAPLAVPPANEPIAAARAAQALDARRARGRRRGRFWLGASIVAPVAAAAWLLFATTLRAPSRRGAPAALPTPTADLLAAQAEATRGGSAALARLDQEMRTYRRQYHEGLRSRGGGAP